MYRPSLLALLLACGSLAPATAAERVTLKIAHFLPASSNAQQHVIQPWCETLARESEQRIQCQIYPSMQLGGTPAQLPDQVRNGVVDIVWTAPGYSPGRFPRSEAVELPFMLPANGVQASSIVWQFYRQALQDDYKGYRVLALHSDGGMQLHTTGKAVGEPEDFKGLKLRASSRMSARLVAGLGAAPVSMPAAQLTESLSKGVIDGALASWELIPALKLDEVTRRHTDVPEGRPTFSITLLGMLMNPRSYERLPDDLKAILDRNSGDALVRRFGEAWDAELRRARERVPADSVANFAPPAYQRLRETGERVSAEWVADAERKGLPGAELARQLRELSQANGVQM
ncbi:TRAP transporter substrate-binding protein [Pseudomonas citronellolis]|uniref:TRAP transporter substrate-binding protein n=1 Tax=Pseudomonas citronellolis TaxID=53408 RepID=UPI0023E407E7|nr:TRAP transporter substrate-binding protein [Pseudomonas citronellolis]MDF3931408.1 TRAP transporter substrate-binding protein [Pseudomonas citronellolis]